MLWNFQRSIFADFFSFHVLKDQLGFFFSFLFCFWHFLSWYSWSVNQIISYIILNLYFFTTLKQNYFQNLLKYMNVILKRLIKIMLH